MEARKAEGRWAGGGQAETQSRETARVREILKVITNTSSTSEVVFILMLWLNKPRDW
jgi:hypothetical protein